MKTKAGFVASICAGAAIGTMIGVYTDSGNAQNNQPTSDTSIKATRPGPGETHRVTAFNAQIEKPQPARYAARYKATRRVTIEPGLRVSDGLLRKFGFVPAGKPLPSWARLPIAGGDGRAVHLDSGDVLLIEWRPFE